MNYVFTRSTLNLCTTMNMYRFNYEQIYIYIL